MVSIDGESLPLVIKDVSVSSDVDRIISVDRGSDRVTSCLKNKTSTKIKN